MRSRRFWSIALAAIASLATVHLSWAQSRGAERPAAVDCVAQCRADPLQAAAECDCTSAGKRRQPDAGRSSSAADLDPARVLANMRAAYEASIASVDNYLVVEKINISPLPSVVYYEKVHGGRSGGASASKSGASKAGAGKTAKDAGPADTPAAAGPRTYFRQVPPSELAQREATANAAAAKTADAKAGAEAMANPMAFLGALASGLDALGKGSGSGLVEGASSGMADVLRKVQSDVTGQAQEDANDTVDDQVGLISEVLELFNTRLEGQRHLEDWNRREIVYAMYGIYFMNRGTPEQRFYREKPPLEIAFDYPSHAYHPYEYFVIDHRSPVIVKKASLPADAVRCLVYTRDVPTDFEYRGVTHTLEEGEVWIAEDGRMSWGRHKHDFSRMVRIRVTVRALGTNGFQRMVIDRETSDYRNAGPMRVPHRTRQRMTMDGKALPEVDKSIQSISVNEGPPTQAQTAAILAKAADRPGTATPTPK